MNGNLRYQYPQVFTVDAAAGLPQQQHLHPQMATAGTEPSLVPCWTFPPARFQTKRRGCGGMNSAAGTLLIMVLLVVFAALGLGAYQIMRLETEVAKLKQEMYKQTESSAPQKLVGHQIDEIKETKHLQAAHLIGKHQDTLSKTLKWESKHGRAFTNGILYRDGGLQVNETGLYFVYSRVEFLARNCKRRDALAHRVYVKSKVRLQMLMSDHKEGFCMAGSTEVWTSGSSLGSIQQLKQGDWVFVNVSQPALLSGNYHSNYFGLFNLS
ncbi:tumor necrosis factor ligand superfamily member 6 [Salminus brasiliensis]|uniref:tumor necrosis factor ligand superfamily member 6 n=1 Tax=Salminus brasiliensis TaxID=930266 RepID=UPI003B83154C